MKVTRNTEFELQAQYPGIGGYLLMGIEDLRALVTETAGYGDSSMVKIVLDDAEGMTSLKFVVVDDGNGKPVTPKPTRAPRTKPAAPKPTVRGRGTASSSGRINRDDF